MARDSNRPAVPFLSPAAPPLPARPVGALDWLATVVFAPLFLLILLAFDPVQRLARLFGRRPQEYAAAALQWAIVAALRLCGTRLEVERAPGVQPRTGYLVVSNHQSMFDITVLGGLLFTNFPKYVAKRELARGIPSVSYNLRVGGSALIDRGDRAQALAEIRRLGRMVGERGVSAVIFPEGTRARDGVMKPFRPAGTLELLEAAPQLPVVPVAIDGSWVLVSHGLRPFRCGARVRVRIGEPWARGEEGAALLARAEEWVAGTLTSWRSPSGPPASPLQ